MHLKKSLLTLCSNPLVEYIALSKLIENNAPRVYLLEAKNGGLKLHGIEVGLPTPVPNVTANKDDLSDEVKRAIKSLREKSPEIRNFLEDRER